MLTNFGSLEGSETSMGAYYLPTYLGVGMLTPVERTYMYRRYDFKLWVYFVPVYMHASDTKYTFAIVFGGQLASF